MLSVQYTTFLIHGTDIGQVLVTHEKFPKLRVTLYSAPSEPERVIAFSYLECIEDRKYFSPSEIPMDRAKEVTQWVLEGGHTPALESLHLLFNIRGMSKVVSHQLVRHRIGVSIDQRTQRANSKEYLENFFDGGHYITPPSIQKLIDEDSDAFEAYDDYMFVSQGLYRHLLRKGISEDDARYIIPQASETSMNFKVIYKALLDSVCSTRMCTIMQGEIVAISQMMAECVKAYNPFLGSWLRPYCLKNGRCNRNENNPIEGFPKGVCHYTQDGTIPIREPNDTFDLTKYSRDNTKV